MNSNSVIFDNNEFPSLSNKKSIMVNNNNNWSKMLQNSLQKKTENNTNIEVKKDFSIENYKNYKKTENVVSDSEEEEDSYDEEL
jgi:hypothetical protein